MATFDYEAYLASKAVAYKEEVSEKISLPDPTGQKAPLKVTLKGTADATDEGYAILAAAQLEKIRAKQKRTETKTGVGGQRIIPFAPEELATVLLEREGLLEAIAEQAVANVEEAKKTRKNRKAKEPDATEPAEAHNRVSELVGSNGNGQT